MTIRQIVPTTVTLVAMLSGFLSMLVTVEGMRNPEAVFMSHPYYRWSALLILVAMILDGLDGNLARWLKGQSEFGAELDTYVDLTAFGIAPAILIFAVALQQEGFWRVILPSAVALSGVVRLARFKVKDPLRGQGGYAGLPITVNAAWVALFVFINQTHMTKEFSLQEGTMAGIFLFGILVFIVLQVTNLRYPKPTKNPVLFSVCVGFVILLSVLALFSSNAKMASWSRLWAIIMISLGLSYIIFGPLFVKGV
jgi:CDP-diacylglycerol---serine O-phosphatidyltransferase